VFAISVHASTPKKAITHIDLANELTPSNLQRLHKEVCIYWKSITHKPTTSVFV
jgi:hypothetical protein